MAPDDPSRPVARGPETPAGGGGPGPSPLLGRVLVVDDRPSLREVLAFTLQEAGIDVVEAATGADALRLTREARPDLVLLDVMLPDIDGREVCRRLKADPELRHTLVMHLSATNWTSEEQVEALDGGADGYVTRPIEDRELVARVKAMLRLAAAERGLRASEQRFRLIADNAHDLIAMLDLDWSFVYLSPSYRKAIGPQAESLKGLDSLRWVHPDDRERVRAHLAAVVATRQPRTTEFRYLSPAGGWSTFEATATCVADDAGAPRYVVVVSRDISERKLLEEQLRESQKLEAVGRLAGGMAHEFSNAMQAMLATIAVARRGRPEQAREALAEVEKLVGRSASTVHKLLFFARPDLAGATELDLDDVARTVADLMRSTAPAAVEVRLDPAASRLPVRAARAQLELAVLNLAANAVDAMPAGGVLTVRTGATGDPEVWLEVADTGAGMAQEVREHLFEPFFTTKGSERGTGLGLPVARRTVQALGGRIEVASTPGQGSTFRIVLPRGAAAPAATTAASNEPRGAGERVLVVEDEDDARKGLVEILGMLGYAVVGAGTGEDALAVPVVPPFDALVTDLRLPGVQGGEVARALRARWPNLAVILMSGYPQEAAAQDLLRSGSARFLQKPFGLDSLVRELRSALDAARP